MFTIKKLRLLFEFYKIVLLNSLGIFVIVWIFSNLILAFLVGTSLGLLITLLLKEMKNNQQAYLFYMNCNLSKLQLYGFSLLLNFFILFILVIFK